MYKRNSIKKLGRTHSHRKALIQNQLRSILSSGKVKTSSVKAKVLRGELESLLSTVKNSKEENLSLIRKLNEILGDKDLVKKIFEITKRGDTKVSVRKVGYRIGDNTEMSIVEIVGFKGKVSPKKKEKVEEKEEVKKEAKPEVKEDGDTKRNILNLGTKTASKKVEPVKRERARTRSGL